MLHPAACGLASRENQLSWLPHRPLRQWGLRRSGMMPDKQLSNVPHCEFLEKTNLRVPLGTLAHFDKELFQRFRQDVPGQHVLSFYCL
jgi:hypothetical protein